MDKNIAEIMELNRQMTDYVKTIIEEIKLLKIEIYEIKNKLVKKSTILEAQKELRESLRQKETIQYKEAVKGSFDERIRTTQMPEILRREQEYQKQLEEAIKRSKEETSTNKPKDDRKKKGVVIEEPKESDDD